MSGIDTTPSPDADDQPTDATADLPPHIVLYDGACGLCHRGVRALMDLDREGVLHYAPLQGETAARLGVEWSEDSPAADDTFVFVDNTGPDPVHHERMQGVLAELRVIGRLPVLVAVLRVLPRPVADGLYRLIAASRYRLFGQFDECRLPTRSQKERFLP